MSRPQALLLLPALLLGFTCGQASHAQAAGAPAPTWVVDPALPGENLPGVGRSLFDRLFAVQRGEQAEIELPFPFEALLARLDAQLQREPASPLPPAKRVLIPLGRSLQRTAAAPDYFAYPRVVVAVDASPAAFGAPLLKDRLYLGYQEKSAVLEVISYNEAAGRFEFQLVKDYRAGGKPKVVYAPRTLCFACHQNGAPIFSRALWDESNANPQVAALLLASGRRFYGIPVERGVDVPYAIDNASERANGFALTQLLWQEGCGGNDVTGHRCRAGLFAATLRHALAGGQSWTADADFEQAVAAPLRAEARRRWPGGLAIGNPDIANRNPLQGMRHWPADSAARVAFSHVAAPFDPLLPRPSREVWRADAPDALRKLVAGLSEFVAATDRARLDAALARPATVPVVRVTAPCRFAASKAASRASLRCVAPGGTLLEGTLAWQAGRLVDGDLTRLTLADGTALNAVRLRPAGRATPAVTKLQPLVDGRAARTAAGNAIAVIEVRRPAGNDHGEVMIEVRQDFAIVQQAVDRLVSGPQAAALFAPAPFPREPLFAALFGELGMAGARGGTGCCQAARALPPPQLEVPAVAPAEPAAAAMPPTAANDTAQRSFQPYCAACHQTAETFPPNFLQGSPAEVVTRLRHCAPRLYVRLAMADLLPEQREKTPMPPESVLPAFASSSQAWRSSPLRAALLAQVEGWLRAETGQSPQLRSMLSAGYEALRPCLPPQ
jgi:mono/diheme cytochrome c family protein